MSKARKRDSQSHASVRCGEIIWPDHSLKSFFGARSDDALVTHVIHLPRSIDRKRTFLSLNQIDGLRFTFEKGVDSSCLDPDILISRDLVRPGTLFRTPGCSLAHRKLWLRCCHEQKAMLICEDDAVFRADFRCQFEACLRALHDDWDFLLLGYNLDCILDVEIIPGFEELRAGFTNHKLAIPELKRFQRTSYPISILPLRAAFGSPGYALSPAGARFLLSNVFPLHNCPVTIRGQCHTATALDALMNGMYAEMKAFACVPPLVISPNEKDPAAQGMQAKRAQTKGSLGRQQFAQVQYFGTSRTNRLQPKHILAVS